MLLSALILTLFCPPGMCMADDYALPGTYSIIAGLSGFENFENTGIDDFKGGWGIDIRIGQRFNRYFALEGELGMISGFDATIDLSEVNPELSGTDKVALDILALTANLKAHLPLGRLDPYALVGVGFLHSNVRSAYPVGRTCWPGYYGWYCGGVYASLDDTNAFTTKFGVGTDFHISQDWAITLDVSYVVPFSKLSDLKYTSFTWGAKFDF